MTATGAVGSAVALVVLFDANGATRAYAGTDTRAFALLFGALFALTPVRNRVAALVSAPRSVGAVACLTIPITLAAIWWYGGEHLGWLLSGGLIVHSLLAATLVCVLSVSRGRLATALSTGALTWLGRLSYGIYLWHWPVIQLGRPRLDEIPRALQDVLLLAISVALAVGSFHLVEHPIRRQLGWARGRRAAWATLAAAAVAATAIVVAPSGRGHVAAFDPGSIAAVGSASAVTTGSSPTVTATTANTATTAITATAAPIPIPTPNTRDAVVHVARAGIRPLVGSVTTVASSTTVSATADSPVAAPADVTDVDSAPAAVTTAPPSRTVQRVLWVGDSVAADQAPAVLAALSSSGLTPIDGSFAGRRVVSSDGVDAETLYPRILAEARADVVVIQLSLWDDQFPAEAQRSAYEWFWSLVQANGAELVFVTPPPLRPDEEHATLAQHVRTVEEFVATHAGTHVIHASGAWGGEFDADIGDDGAPDRKPDGLHVCPQGAARFASWLVDELDRIYDGLTPVFPAAWVAGPWTTHVNYDTPVGSCAAVDPSAG